MASLHSDNEWVVRFKKSDQKTVWKSDKLQLVHLIKDSENHFANHNAGKYICTVSSRDGTFELEFCLLEDKVYFNAYSVKRESEVRKARFYLFSKTSPECSLFMSHLKSR